MKRQTAAKRDELVHGVRKGFRRHHNTDGRAQIKSSGVLYLANKAMAKRLGIRFKNI